MPVMVADLFLQIFSGVLFRILFGRVFGKIHNPQTRLARYPVLDFFARMVWRAILPNHDLAARTSAQNLLIPANRRVAVLPINGKRRDFSPGPQMHRAI
jgi:hypothetical protein